MVVARLVWCKGVKEFIEAAAIVMSRRPDLRFLLVGPSARGHPDSVPDSYLKGKTTENCRVVTNFREDIREILSISDVVALPTYFREGVPRVLLEALALGKPVVTTDNPGCRETVDNGENGYLVPVRSSQALAEAIMKLMEDELCGKRFGQRSRRKAEREFDERLVVSRILTDLYGFGELTSAGL